MAPCRRRGRLQFLADANQLLELAELRQLSEEMNGIGGVGWILILDLGYQQLQKSILRRQAVDAGSGGGLVAVMLLDATWLVMAVELVTGS